MVISTDKPFNISESNQKLLLSVARKAIEKYLTCEEIEDFEIKADEELSQPLAVFVTLSQFEALRGCIGTTEALYPLYEAVIRMAISAAFHDSRFYPVTLDDLKDIKIEISVLSPMKRINSIDEIIPDINGVMLEKDGKSGLFLPQVWEHFKSRDIASRRQKFLNELCSQKAGLPLTALKEPSTNIFTFTVFSFKDK